MKKDDWIQERAQDLFCDGIGCGSCRFYEDGGRDYPSGCYADIPKKFYDKAEAEWNKTFGEEECE